MLYCNIGNFFAAPGGKCPSKVHVCETVLEFERDGGCAVARTVTRWQSDQS